MFQKKILQNEKQQQKLLCHWARVLASVCYTLNPTSTKNPAILVLLGQILGFCICHTNLTYVMINIVERGKRTVKRRPHKKKE